MANTLTGLIPILYESLDVVSRELVGFIPAVSRDSNAERAGLNQTITAHIAPESEAKDITPAVTAPDDGDQTIDKVDIKITRSRGVAIRWNGEEQRALSHGGQYRNILRDQFTQAMRTLCNEVEADLASTYVAASRAYGTAGTAPFGSAGDLSDAAKLLEILDDNGAPLAGRQLVLGSAAMANLRGKQSVLFKANEAGTDALLREGIVGRIESFDVRNSAQVKRHVKGTGTGYETNGTFDVGDATVAVDTGTGTIKAGDIITFADDGNKYVVGSDLSAGSLSINKPGLRQDLADGKAVTVGDSYTANMAFVRSAIVLVTRTPAMPEGGDSADDVLNVTDPVSGLSFQVAVYRQYRQVRYEIGLAWGWQAVKPEHMALLLG